jgi:hypothetical protein
MFHASFLIAEIIRELCECLELKYVFHSDSRLPYIFRVVKCQNENLFLRNKPFLRCRKTAKKRALPTRLAARRALKDWNLSYVAIVLLRSFLAAILPPRIWFLGKSNCSLGGGPATDA